MPLDNARLESLNRLSQHPDGRVLLDHLNAELDRYTEELMKCDAPEVFRAQGKRQALKSLIDDITGAAKRKALAESGSIRRGLNTI